MAVGADGLCFLAEQDPLAVVPGVVFELPADKGGVGADEFAVPVLGKCVDHIAVLLSEEEISRLEWNSARSRLELGDSSEMTADTLNGNVLLVGDGRVGDAAELLQ